MTAPDPIPPLLLVGGGKMGGAMLSGWREQGLAPSVVVDPAPAARDHAGVGVEVVAEAAAIPAGFAPRVIVFAVKPQMAERLLPAYAALSRGAIVLSIMAGRTMASLRTALGPETLVVRSMPNLPAAIRQGMTVACAGEGVDEEGRALCQRLLEAVGAVGWVEDESLLDSVTAISGSGPAYVFLLAELLERAARDHGLAPDLARRMARRTLAGAGALLEASAAAESADLRRAVTSPGGTTEAALAVLMGEGAWPALVARAVDAASARARELAS